MAASARRTRHDVTVAAEVHSDPDDGTRCWMKAGYEIHGSWVNWSLGKMVVGVPLSA